MKMYINARVPRNTPLALTSAARRSEALVAWVEGHSDREIREQARRLPRTGRDTVSVALSLPSKVKARLEKLLDGKTHTFSALVSRVLEERSEP